MSHNTTSIVAILLALSGVQMEDTILHSRAPECGPLIITNAKFEEIIMEFNDELFS